MPPTGRVLDAPQINSKAARRAAHTRWMRRYRAEGRRRLVPADGSVRRVQALQVLGHRYRDIADATTVSAETVRGALDWDRERVSVHTADAIAAAYRVLSDRPGPSAVTASRAVARGWLPPIAWDDDTIDDPFARPYAEQRDDGPDAAAVARIWARNRPDPLREADRQEFVRQAASQGVPDVEIGEYLGWHRRASGERTPDRQLAARVRGYRARHGIATTCQPAARRTAA
jgi:hypothetical protein